MCAAQSWGLLYALLGNNIVKNQTQEAGGPIWHKKACTTPRERSKRKVTGNRADKAVCPTSLALTANEKTAVETMAKKLHVSTSDLMRRGVRHVLAQDRAVTPESVGVVDSIYPATIQDDVVALSNLLVTLAFNVGLLDQHITRRKRDRARELLQEAIDNLSAIAGRVNVYKNNSIHSC